MSGEHSYRMVGSAQRTSASSSPSTTPESTPPNDRNLHLAAPKARRPPTFVSIHQSSNISWAPSPSQNLNGSPIASGSKSLIVGSQHVSSVQRIPPTPHYNLNGSILQDINSPNTLVSSSTNNSEIPVVPSEPVNFRDDIELDDQGLVTISTKELNRRLKKKGLSKSRQKEIKGERRTLKNRGK